jgi:hypothetical protein
VKPLIEFIARALVDHPDQVDVREVQGDQAQIIELRVARSDLGKVIGRQGRTAAAMRTLLQAAAGKRRALLDIVD